MQITVVPGRAWFPCHLLALALLAGAARPAESQTSAGGQPASSPVGRPSAAALTSAHNKQAAMREPKGPESVTLTADEMASLIQAGLDLSARRALDSIRVRLAPGRITLNASLVTSAFDASILGPMAMMLGAREPVSVSGPARAVKAGLIAWEPDAFIVRSFSFPPAVIPPVINQLTGASDGTVSIAVPPAVLQIRIDPAGVTFSRRTS